MCTLQLLPVLYLKSKETDQPFEMNDPINLNFILWMALSFPVILFYSSLLITVFVFLFLLPVFKVLEKCVPCSSHNCVDFKQVCRTAWKTAKHPSILLDMLKRLLFEIKERNKKSPTQKIFTIEEIQNCETNPKFNYNSKFLSVLLFFYSSLFTVIIWPRYFYLDSFGVNAFGI